MTEKDEIKRSGAKAQKNSGRGQFSKGDATLGEFLVDIKEYGKSFGLSKAMWSKVCTDAFQEGLEPALKVVLGKEGESRVRLWVISDEKFQEMRECYEKVHMVASED